MKKTLAPADGLWVAWPKKASNVETDLDFATVEIGLAAGLVDNKSAAITETGRRSASSTARRIGLGSIAGAVSVYNLERLDNGLRILTAPMDSAQSVTCAIMLAAGSRYETPETNGIAHFAEH
ncbi:MAG: insulinase family protein, partial [Actinomycetota bacterium]|nr:insulinase family protein [Actinomycetota bacterium]